MPGIALECVEPSTARRAECLEAFDRLARTLGRRPTCGELAAALGVREAQVRHLLRKLQAEGFPRRPTALPRGPRPRRDPRPSRREREVLERIYAGARDRGCQPGLAAIGKALGVAPGTVSYYLECLRQKGYLGPADARGFGAAILRRPDGAEFTGFAERESPCSRSPSSRRRTATAASTRPASRTRSTRGPCPTG